MYKLVQVLAAAAFALAALTVAGHAADYSCKSEVSVTGNGAVLSKGGERKALSEWRDAVRANFGVFYSDDKIANEGRGVTVERCNRSSIGLMVCQARGRPCIEVQEAATYLECKAGDSKNCDPQHKWIQNKLQGLGYNVGGVDGVIGTRTQRAIEKFVKDKGLAAGSIKAVIEALQAA